MSSEEEDYMSDAFLTKAVEDVRPGLVMNRITSRQNEISTKKNRLDEEHRIAQKPLHVVERERREEGLSQAISSDNKGFTMLTKLGYKAGDSLGRSTAAIAEPIKIEVKSDRGGLGKKSADEYKLEQMRTRNAASKDINWTEITDGFRQRINQKCTEKELRSTLYKCQKVCEQFDSTNSIETPTHDWFWPSKTAEQIESSDEDDPEPEDEYDSDSEKSKSDNSNSDTGDDADDADDANERPKKRRKRKQNIQVSVPIEINLDFTLEQQVDTLMTYLRSKYFYCLWCGWQFKDPADLFDSCPGPSKDLH